MRILLLALLTLTTAGCASYLKRKSCESINWFEHGQKVALSGKWLNADATINECRKVEADIQESQLDKGFKSGMEKYCSKEHSYLTGKSGDPYSRDLCEGPMINVLMSEHQRGVKDYCAKTNAFAAGSSGKKYQNLCPKDLESLFLPEYRKGRKKYVETVIANRQEEIRQLETRVSSLRTSAGFEEMSLRNLEFQKSSLESQKLMIRANNPEAMHEVESDISQVEHQISAKRSDISDIESDLRKVQNEIAEKQKEISALREELPSLSH